MKIIKLRLENFKRFTDFTIENIPPSTKLVLLIGGNGSGKSSIFDSFEAFNSRTRGDSYPSVKYYFKNEIQFSIKLVTSDAQENSIYGDQQASLTSLKKDCFFGRTSFRQVSRLTRTQFGQSRFDVTVDSDRPRQYIDQDVRFENDLEKITERILKELFQTQTPSNEIRARYIDPINESLDRIFGKQNGTQLRLLEIIPPLEGKVAQVRFRKGSSEIHYDNLSAGEKEVVNILINLLVRREYYRDSVYFFDELDLHLNTAIQSTLLKEIVEQWIPDNCQVWTASHSLGFIDYARQSDDAEIINLDDLDFDQPQILTPEPRHNLEVYDIAVPTSILFELMKGKRIIFCENKNDKYYNLLLLPNTIFVGVRESRDVFLKVKQDNRSHSLRDRDFLSDTEIQRICAKYPQHHILRYYAFENYLYHPDNIAELNPPAFDKSNYTAEIVKQKNERVHYLLTNIGSSRLNYEEFRTDDKLKDRDTHAIVDDFKSDEFERFYKYFDMKVNFNKTCLSPLGLTEEQLSKTIWFKTKIQEIVGN